MRGIDQRSVGELLIEADHTARSILTDVHDMHAATMLRTWGEVVQAAAELWQALPPATPPRPGTDQRAPDFADLTMQRLQGMTAARHRRHKAEWPGDGPPEERHLQIAATFARAEDLISRHATKSSMLDARQLADLNAARTRIMHTLYIGSHGVTVAVGHHLRELESRLAAHGRIPAGESLRRARAAYEHMTVFEQLAGTVVAKTYPTALAGEHRDPPAANRLALALADWDVVGHRVLVKSTHIADLTLAARTQALILTGSNVLLHAAAELGHVDPVQHRARLEPAIVASQERWESLAVTLAALTPPSDRRTNPDLSRASLEVRAAMRELLLDAATTAAPAVIAHRTDLGRIPGVVGHVLGANLDLAHVTQEVAHDRSLAGAARGIHAIAAAGRPARHPDAIDDSPLRAAVTPRDLLSNRAIPLPYFVRAELTDAATSIVDAAAAAVSAGAQLGSRLPTVPHHGGSPTSVGRTAQERDVGLSTSSGPAGPACER